ncbi:hypothetical protein ASD12_09600 [Mesorhizobium sp. Root102]|jgi:hypothetical protein|uniref:hypothetical protein n=1 Tax=Mesorhizobium sp. Root102 TaxID=1736422 RepID=UPI0007146D0C|nr:hypothetical protein [Mesorhizobium sp. Root102]KQU83286.1 hypothetical protein ASD12_09600 [Mesorhizobium sp. Root102]
MLSRRCIATVSGFEVGTRVRCGIDQEWRFRYKPIHSRVRQASPANSVTSAMVTNMKVKGCLVEAVCQRKAAKGRNQCRGFALPWRDR